MRKYEELLEELYERIWQEWEKWHSDVHYGDPAYCCATCPERVGNIISVGMPEIGQTVYITKWVFEGGKIIYLTKFPKCGIILP